VAQQESWKEGVAKEVAAATNRDQEANAREVDRREQTEAHKEAVTEKAENDAIRDREAQVREDARLQRAEDRFEAFLQAFERPGGIRASMESIVADLRERGLAAELEVQELVADAERAASCTATIRIPSPSDGSAHANVEVVGSGKHLITLLTIVQSQSKQREGEESIALEDLTEDRIGESVLTVVREMLRP